MEIYQRLTLTDACLISETLGKKIDGYEYE
jgi:hypothetical protein